jgi:hypothetical protein
MLKFSADNEACALFMRVAKNRLRNYMCIKIATLNREEENTTTYQHGECHYCTEEKDEVGTHSLLVSQLWRCQQYRCFGFEFAEMNPTAERCVAARLHLGGTATVEDTKECTQLE